MKRNDWKRQLQQDAWNHVPNQLSAIQATLQHTEQVAPVRTHSRWIPRVLGLGGLAAAVALGLLVWLTPPSAPILTEAYVSIDINPSLELMIDGNQKVLVQIPRNEAATIVLNGVDLVGESLEEAVARFIEEATQAGYLDVTTSDNAILLEAVHENNEWEVELRQSLQHAAEQAFQQQALFGVVLTGQGSPELKAAASEADLSVGKYYLVNQLLTLDASLNFDDLKTESVRQLQQMITERDVTQPLRNEALVSDLDHLESLYEQYVDHPSVGNRHRVEAKLNQLNGKYGKEYAWEDLSTSALGQWREEPIEPTNYGQFVAAERSNKRNARNTLVASVNLPSIQQQLRAQCDEAWLASEQTRYQQDWNAAKASWATKFETDIEE